MAEQLLAGTKVQWFTVAQDFVNNKVVLVTLREDGTTWWQELTLPTRSLFSWSTPQQVTFPSGSGPNLVEGNLWLVSSPQQRLICFGLTYDQKVFAFRIGDTAPIMLSLPSNVTTGRRIAASEMVANGTANEILLVGDDINDNSRLYRANFTTSQWPPARNGDWEDWGATGWNRPAFAYGPTTITAFKMNGSTLYRCWAHQSDMNWGSWWSLGNISGSASNVAPQPMAWHSEPDKPQADAVFVHQADSSLLYAYETGADSTSWYSLSTVPKITATAHPVLVPWTNITLLMVNQGGQVSFSQYWLKENIFTRLQSATSIGDVKTFTGQVIEIEGGPMDTTPFLVGFYHRDDGVGIWIDGIDIGHY